MTRFASPSLVPYQYKRQDSSFLLEKEHPVYFLLLMLLFCAPIVNPVLLVTDGRPFSRGVLAMNDQCCSLIPKTKQGRLQISSNIIIIDVFYRFVRCVLFHTATAYRCC
jgi:hypothetical protein